MQALTANASSERISFLRFALIAIVAVVVLTLGWNFISSTIQQQQQQSHCPVCLPCRLKQCRCDNTNNATSTTETETETATVAADRERVLKALRWKRPRNLDIIPNLTWGKTFTFPYFPWAITSPALQDNTRVLVRQLLSKVNAQQGKNWELFEVENTDMRYDIDANGVRFWFQCILIEDGKHIAQTLSGFREFTPEIIPLDLLPIKVPTQPPPSQQQQQQASIASPAASPDVSPTASPAADTTTAAAATAATAATAAAATATATAAATTTAVAVAALEKPFIQVAVISYNRSPHILKLGESLQRAAAATGDNRVGLLVVDFNSTDAHVPTLLANLTIPVKVEVIGDRPFTRAFARHTAVSLVKDPNAIIFMCDADMTIPNNLLERIRIFVKQGVSAYSPICYYLISENPPGIPLFHGGWGFPGVGNIAFYRSDYDRSTGYDLKFVKWGSEDTYYAQALMEAGIEIISAYEQNFLHHPHGWSG